MFQVPHRLPIGIERSRMGPVEFSRRAAPALADAYRHEQGVMQIFEECAKDIHGGEKIAYTAFNKDPRVKEDWGKDRLAMAAPPVGNGARNRSNESQITNLLADDVRARAAKDTPEKTPCARARACPRSVFV